MNNIQDLHFKKEIIPLFDFVCCEASRDALIDIMSDIPPTQEEVLKRQEILQAFLLQSDKFLLPFSYARSEFNEVAAYIQDWRVRPNPDLPALRLQYLVKRTLREKEKGRLTLLYLFLHKTDQAWFSHINPDNFPPAFADTLEELPYFRGLALDRQGYPAPSLHLPHIQYHPVYSIGFLYPLLKSPVTNTITIRENVTLITGPNMSGKSTLLKSLGLTVLLARLGLAVPASACQLPFFDQIYVAIDLHDDLKSGYSHFMQEVVTTASPVSRVPTFSYLPISTSSVTALWRIPTRSAPVTSNVDWTTGIRSSPIHCRKDGVTLRSDRSSSNWKG